MTRRSAFIAGLAAALSVALWATAAAAQTPKPGLERLYVIDCGTSLGPDKARWTPGIDVGKPLPMVGNCYLIKHAQGWMIWDTGVTDEVAKMPDGQPGTNGSPHWWRTKTLAGEIEKLGLKPSDIKYLAVSHTHPDHNGNVELFPQSMLLVQRAEYDWPGPNNTPRFAPGHPVTKLDGDHDVFGDGSVTIISTPGHTPGHQCLLVKLPKFGAVLLTGDAVHIQESWDKRIVPANNVDRDKTLTSYKRLADIMAQTNAKMWINHDAPQRASMKLSPEYYE
ncbi:MAG: N-acyl homoserine lactone hydrolase [Sphingomonadales bacterium]|jgi:N-acyl homoserine lactone hydrolase|nr:N-acyl homoserine lactone hydrolase [Sphingomonadales bacterium]